MLSHNQVEQYFKRLNVQHIVDNKSSTLMALHQAHMLNVPFENIDIHLGHEIHLSIAQLFEKVVMNKRGGFCYELNYLFAALLTTCDFKVSLLSAQVFDGGALGREFDHMLLLVGVEDTHYIADVGFGDSFIFPIELGTEPVEQFGYQYKLMEKNEKQVLLRKKINENWQPQYTFSLTPYQIEAFKPMCEFQQTSLESSFTKKSVCSIATQTGRLTISNGKFIETNKGIRSEKLIGSSKSYRQILQEYFNMPLVENISLTTWNKLGIRAVSN